MKIQFCDLCSESVPDADFSLGRAFRRQGRVVCSACDSSMTSGASSSKPGSAGELMSTKGGGSSDSDATRLSAGVGPGSRSAKTLAASPAPIPSDAPAVSAPVGRRRIAAPGWTAVFALALVVGGGYYFHGEVQTLRAADAEFQSTVVADLGELGESLDTFSLNSQKRGNDLENRLGATMVRNQEAWKGASETLQAELDRVSKHLVTLDKNLLRLEGIQKTDSVDNGRRLDDFLAQSMKLRVEMRDLRERLQNAEELAGGERPAALSASAAVPTKKALPYAAHLVDLKSDVAGTRWNAVSALGELGDPEVVPHLIPHLKDSNSFVRMAVARVFGDLNSPLAIEPLIDALEDQEPVVREAAMQALHTITGRDFRFDPQAKESDRKKRVDEWRSWWKKSSQDFVGDL